MNYLIQIDGKTQNTFSARSDAAAKREFEFVCEHTDEAKTVELIQIFCGGSRCGLHHNLTLAKQGDRK